MVAVKRPKVSVCITTYNHEKYIAEALDSVLAQQTEFSFEILVGEDDSSDLTKEIVEQYARKHSIIRPFYRAQKDKIFIHGRPTGRQNFIKNLESAKGEYIALLDGDDYWTDTNKLAKQAELLDDAQEVSVVFHRLVNQSEDGNGYVFPAADRYPAGKYKTQHLLRENFIATGSVMFRNWSEYEFQDWFLRVPYADWPLHLLNSLRGEIFLIDDVMAVRREHGEGRWSSTSVNERMRWDIEFFQEMSIYFDKAYSDYFRNRAGKEYKKLISKTVLEKGFMGAYREMKEMEKRFNSSPSRLNVFNGIANAYLKKLKQQL